jgi:hypothetical protein
MTDEAERPRYIAALILNGTQASGTSVDMTVIGNQNIERAGLRVLHTQAEWTRP